jgi:hypothetical protein
MGKMILRRPTDQLASGYPVSLIGYRHWAIGL